MEELKRLQTENEELREQVKELLGLREQNQSLQEQVKDLQEQLGVALSNSRGNVSSPPSLPRLC